MAKHEAKLTKRAIDAVAIPETGETWVWDTELAGFFLRVRPSGRKVYAVRYRLGSQQNTFTIGVHGAPWTPDDARKAAFEALKQVSDGRDPSSEKKEARQALTVGGLIDAYLKDGPATKPNKRASTWQIDGSNLTRHIRPLLGRKLADAVSKADAARAIQAITDGKTAADIKTKARGRAMIKGGAGTARRTRTTAAAMYAWGIEHSLVKTNPFAAVKLSAPPVKERFLSDQEAAKLLEAIADLQSRRELSETFADAIRLLLLSGARKTEVLALKWSEVDWDRRALCLPPQRTKSGNKTGERRIILSPPALALLKRRRSALAEAEAKAAKAGEAVPDSPFIFPASRGEGPAIGLRKAFAAAVKAAGIEGLRVHDLRHSFASFAIADGASLFLVGKLLGHTNSRTTERYAHLAGDPLQDAAASVGKRFAIPEGDGAEVIQMPRRA
jgi:integrase